jgi:DNA polymerase-4
LHSFGIRTIGDLAVFPTDVLRRRFGKIGSDLSRLARGQGNDKVLTPEELPAEKSMGHAYTFSHDITDPALLSGSLHLLCERVARRLRAKQRAGKVVTITVRYHGMETHTHGHKLKRNVDQEADVFTAASELFHQIYEPPRPVRLLGVSVSELESTVQIRQCEMFTPQRDPAQVARVYDDIRERFGINSIGYASGLFNSSNGSLKSRRGASAHVISVGFRPFYSTA